MLPLVLVMQLDGPALPPAQEPRGSASAPPPAQEPPSTASALPPAAPAPPPPYYPAYVLYPVQPYPVAPPAPKPERATTWFVRFAFGLGSPGFSGETSLLRLEGYGGQKFWAAIDGGYFFHPNVGFGPWLALSRWSSKPNSEAPALGETAYFVGGELPIQVGSRAASFVIAPRVGLCSGELDLGGHVPFHSALAYGADLAVVSFKYHLMGSLGLLRAAIAAPGALGREHDFGGFQVLLGGTIDG